MLQTTAQMSEYGDSTAVSDGTTILTLPNGISLRRYALTDVETAIQSLNNPAVRLHLRNAIPTPYTETDAKWWINNCNNATTWLQSGPWMEHESQHLDTTTKTTTTAPDPTTPPTHPLLLPTHYIIAHNGMQIGAIGINIKDDIYFRTAELGYWLAESHWRQGIMGNVVGAFVRWVFATFGIVYRIEAQVAEKNVGSAAVLRKAGFVFEGRRQGAVWKNGQAHAEDIWGLVRA